MGSQKSRIPLAVIGSKQSLNQANQDELQQTSDSISIQKYDDFEEFIEKQSLKKLNYILVIEKKKHPQKSNSTSSVANGRNTKQSANGSASQKYWYEPPKYLRDIGRLLDRNDQQQQIVETKTSGSGGNPSSDRDKIINYIKKYSLESLSLYIYSENLSELIIPESQMSHITLLSDSIQTIKYHMLNEQKEQIFKVKFKRLVKDLYRKKLVVVVTDCYRTDSKSLEMDLKMTNEEKQDMNQLNELERQFIRYKFSYEFITSVEKLAKKIISMYPQFIICYGDEYLLQLIEFKKSYELDSKIIYFPKSSQSVSFNRKNDGQKDSQLFKKKANEIWWTSSQFITICKVMEKWWYAKNSDNNGNGESFLRKKRRIAAIKQQQQKKSSLASKSMYQDFENVQASETQICTNTVIFVDKCHYALNAQKILLQMKQRIELDEQEELKKYEQQKSKNQNNQSTKVKPRHISFENLNILLTSRIDEAFEKVQESLYTVFIILDVSDEKFEDIKKKIVINDLSTRVQLTLVQGEVAKAAKKSSDMDRDREMEILSKKMLKSLCNRKNFQMKFQISLLEYVNCYELTSKQHSFFEDNMGLIVNRITEDSLHEYMPQKLLYNGKIRLKKIFTNFYIVCNVKNYMQKFLPHLQKLEESIIASKQMVNYFKRLKIIIYEEDDKQKDLMSFYKKHIGEEKKRRNKRVLFMGDSVSGGKASESVQVAGGTFQYPNIEYVHCRLSDIEQQLIYAKSPKLSFAFFPKFSLKNFFQQHIKVENILHSRSFSLQSTFVSNNDFLQQVFQEKTVPSESKFEMNFIKFSSSTSRVQEMITFEEYIRRYGGLWRMKFLLNNSHSNGDNSNGLIDGTVLNNRQKFNPKSIVLIKNELKRCFYKCKSYELLRLSQDEFKYFYIDRVEQCQNLLDLQIAMIYIYSLPHGMSDIIGEILSKPLRSALSIEVFCTFIIILMLNFYSFDHSKRELSNSGSSGNAVVYIQDPEKINALVNTLKETDIIFNKNLLHCLKDENEAENNKNHCLFINLDSLPQKNDSFRNSSRNNNQTESYSSSASQQNISVLLDIERFAFYKESAEYIIAPFTKLKLTKKQTINEKHNLYFEIVPQRQVNIFLHEIFRTNHIVENVLLEALEDSIVEQSHKGEVNERLVGLTTVAGGQRQFGGSTHGYEKAFQQNSTQRSNGQKNLSLYCEAEIKTLRQQKLKVKRSIQIGIQYAKFLRALNSRKYFTAENQLQEIFLLIKNQNNTAGRREQKQIFGEQKLKLELLRVQKSLLNYKTASYGSSLDELNRLSAFLEREKFNISEKDEDKSHLNRIIEIRKKQIEKVLKERQHRLDHVEPVKQWKITMRADSSKGNASGNPLADILFDGGDGRKEAQMGTNEQRQQSTDHQNRKKKVIKKPKCSMASESMRWKVSYEENQEEFCLKNTYCHQSVGISPKEQFKIERPEESVRRRVILSTSMRMPIAKESAFPVESNWGSGMKARKSDQIRGSKQLSSNPSSSTLQRIEQNLKRALHRKDDRQIYHFRQMKMDFEFEKIKSTYMADVSNLLMFRVCWKQLYGSSASHSDGVTTEYGDISQDFLTRFQEYRREFEEEEKKINKLQKDHRQQDEDIEEYLEHREENQKKAIMMFLKSKARGKGYGGGQKHKKRRKMENWVFKLVTDTSVVANGYERQSVEKASSASMSQPHQNGLSSKPLEWHVFEFEDKLNIAKKGKKFKQPVNHAKQIWHRQAWQKEEVESIMRKTKNSSS